MSERAIKMRISHDRRYIALAREKDGYFIANFYLQLWRSGSESLCYLEDRRLPGSKTNNIQSIKYATAQTRDLGETAVVYSVLFFPFHFSRIEFSNECLAPFLPNDKVDEHALFAIVESAVINLRLDCSRAINSLRLWLNQISVKKSNVIAPIFRIKARSFVSRKPLLPRRVGFFPNHDFGRTRWLTVTKNCFHSHRSRSHGRSLDLRATQWFYASVLLRIVESGLVFTLTAPKESISTRNCKLVQNNFQPRVLKFRN